MGNLKKKGIFFTFIAITIAIVFAFIFTPQSSVSMERNSEALKSRISSLDNYVSDLENRYFENILRATGHKAISSLISYVEVKKAFIPESDFDGVFAEVMLDGTISEPLGSSNHVPIDSITGKTIMEGNTLIDWSNKIKEAAADALNANTIINIEPSSIKASQDIGEGSPWDIELEMELGFNVETNDINVKWKVNALKVKTNIGILGFNDPYYLVIINPTYKNQIKSSSVKFDEWDIAKVTAHLNNNEYVHWEDSKAPSFLMRLTGTLAQSECCGIESFIKPSIVSPSDQTEVYMDYLFWNPSSSPTCPTPPTGDPELYSITGLPPQFNGFKLDPANVIKYNLQSNAVPAC